MKPGDLVIVRPFPSYYPTFLAESEKLVGMSGIIVERAPSHYGDPDESWIVLIDNKLLEFGKEELELKSE